MIKILRNYRKLKNLKLLTEIEKIFLYCIENEIGLRIVKASDTSDVKMQFEIEYRSFYADSFEDLKSKSEFISGRIKAQEILSKQIVHINKEIQEKRK